MKFREVWQVIVFGFITFGLYDLYWLHATRNELVAKGQKVPHIIILLIPVVLISLAWLAMIAFWIIMSISSGGSVSAGQDETKAAIAFFVSFAITMLALLISVPIVLYWFYQYCRAMSNVIGGQMNFGLWYALSLLFGFMGFFPVWPGIVQEEYNKIAAKPAKPAIPASSVTT